MSDKSFGDQTNRNVVKNPLLSTAVTGLSLEELTHNAVLLPVAQSQGLIARQEQQPGPQNVTQTPTNTSGDISSRITRPQLFTPPSDLHQNVSKTPEHLKASPSKASVKADDDFDVNEYFARLQGSRYVSAPLNTLQANLDAPEENLEEINLNEPEKSPNVEVQQSLTADIAQNFSQLPTVLPQVASAVFSSFSNMLSYKSREQTPDVQPVKQSEGGYQEVQFQKPGEVEVPLLGVDDVSAPAQRVAPPPKEPPIGGTSSSFRINTKKKTYAQIPGLSSSHVPIDNLSQIPKDTFDNRTVTQSLYNPNETVNLHAPVDAKSGNNETHMDQSVPKEYNIFNPIESQRNDNAQVPINIEPTFYDVKGNDTAESKSEQVVPTQAFPQQMLPTQAIPQQMIPTQPIHQQMVPTQATPQEFTNPSQATAGIIPPPPMFSNLTKRDSLPPVGKSVLPPSVARRIGANNPIIQQNTMQSAAFPTNNIFIPAPVSDNVLQDAIGLERRPSLDPSKSVSPDPAGPSAFVQFKPTYTITNRGTYETLSDAHDGTFSSSRLPLYRQPIPPPTSTSPRLSSPPNQFALPEHMTIRPTYNPANISTITMNMSVPRKTEAYDPSYQTLNLGPALPARVPLGHHHRAQRPFPRNPDIDSSNLFTPECTQDAPPTFLNPTTIQPCPLNENVIKTGPINPPPQSIAQYFDQNISSEATKPISEPPKVSGGFNYRMNKKRPQYYSGPIDGIGNISNNVKPVVPGVEPTAFQGALFTPDQSLADQQVPIEQSAFDINKPAEMTSSYASFAINNQINNQAQRYVAPEYNTPFDLSRPKEENYGPSDYEQPKQDSTGFGIIGSLKSKLSSLDINKIQHSVTTFFDPAYNDTKKDPAIIQGSAPYASNQGQVPVDYSSQDSNLEIYVPNVEAYGQSYNSQMQYQNIYSSTQLLGPKIDPVPFHPYIANRENQPKLESERLNYVNLMGQNSLSQDLQRSIPGLNTQSHLGLAETPLKDMQADTRVGNSQQYVLESVKDKNINIAPVPASVDINYNTYNLFANTDVETVPPSAVFDQIQENSDNAVQHSLTPGPVSGQTKDNSSNLAHLSLTPGPISGQKKDGSNNVIQQPSIAKLGAASAISFFDNVMDQTGNVQLIPEKEHDITSNIAKAFAAETNLNVLPDFGIDTIKTSTLFGIGAYGNEADFVENTFGCGFVRKESVEDITNDVVKTIVTDLLESEEPDDKIPTVDMSSVPLFGLSTILAEKAKEITDLENNMQNVTLEEELKSLNTQRESELCDHDNKTRLPTINDDISDLNICETCREIDKPEDKEIDNLTSKLIENITSPVQLLNPVVAALTELDKPKDSSDDFEHKQCSEISYITEETIDTMQVHSATNLLDNVDEVNDTNVRNYGWTTEEKPVLSLDAPIDNSYTFQVDPSALGFFGNNPMFFENIPNNASDELKAEFKSSQDEVPAVLPRQLSIPSAPPAEDDDNKSDETGGLDVLSIEQDAKKDFPIFEDFVIEPSETDDDKIEYKEREKSSEDSEHDIDSFTNRVEKYKQMEETVEKNDDVFEPQSNIFDLTATVSPPTTIASYFDTGNYAVEAHYRNSLSSPSTVPVMNSPEGPMRIPPGFEDEYKRRMSELVVPDGDADKNDGKNIPSIPETSTQTRPVLTVTCSIVANLSPTLTVSSNTKRKDDEPLSAEMQLPGFLSVFGKSHEAGDAQSSAISKIEDKMQSTAVLFGSPAVEKTEAPPVPLPDPISFFSAGTEESSNTETTDIGFNRLASYFQTPAKTDHGKSFFELSQSQNHYRHALGNHNIDNNNQTAQNSKVIKDFLNSNQNLNSFTPISNIPADILSANFKLMQDLTSVQNIAFPNDQIVRTVNYFTVEYDNEEIKTPLKPDSKSSTERINKTDTNAKKSEENDREKTKDDENKELITIISKCVYCCNFDSRNVVTLNKVEIEKVDFTFKKCMNTEGTEPNKVKAEGMSRAQEERRREVAVSFDDHLDEEHGVSILSENRNTGDYSPVKHHWFYRVDVEGKSIWRGFSANDSKALEESFHSADLNENTLVPTDGGRFDVNVMGRLRIAVYWTDKPTNVRRCSWFYKGATDARYVPYTEPVAEKLEEEYRHGVTTGEWHRRLILPNNESVVMHGPGVMVHFPTAAEDSFSSTPQTTMRPRVVRRGCDETEIEDTEPSSIDHLLLLCHGVGSACDMRFRSVEEVVDDFRSTSLQLLQSHYRNSYDSGAVNRVEVLPISWHSSLHSGETGVDRRLAAITLDSIPRLRNFTNDTVLDVLFYTSPVFCQTILDAVCAELNRIYELFKSRNPKFKGNVSLGGHSLGSVILYDLLCHQATEALGKSFVSGPAGTGQPSVRYPALAFRPAAMYALGSPIAMFECIRGVKSLGAEFSLPTCKNFFNIFHPYDPIAYRIEPLINSNLGDVKPSQIPHHKGRKRMHLELKDTMARVGADLKQKLMESIRATWTSMWKSQPPNDGQLEKVVEEEMEKEQLCDPIKEEFPQINDLTSPTLLGQLNAGRRVDYVLQEAPFEMINEYLFAMSSHVCYWESEDTMLLILREIYDAIGVQPDCTVPMHSMTVQRTKGDDSETVVLNASEHPSTSRGGT